MSIKVQSYVWENSKASGSSLLLLLAIADFAHDDGTGAWPSIDTLAKKCRQTPRNVTFLLRKLEDAGELKVIVNGGPHDCNAYSIPLSSGEIFSPPPKTRAQNRTKGMKTSASGGEKQESQISPDPSGTIIEPSENHLYPGETDSSSEEFAAVFQTVESAMHGMEPPECEQLRELWQDVPDLEAHHFAYLQTIKYADSFNLAYYRKCLYANRRQNAGTQESPPRSTNGNGRRGARADAPALQTERPIRRAAAHDPSRGPIYDPG